MADLSDEIKIFMRVLELIGAFAGAISGVRLASVKRFDWFGASVIGFITAAGGGTLRDVLLRVEPFWMSDPSYIIVSALAVVSIWLFGRRFISGQITWFVFDTISISLFMMIGLHKAILHSYHPWCAIVLGVVTAVAGGILRDICINEVPLIFRKEIYAMACVVGGVVFGICDMIGLAGPVAMLACGAAVFLTRVLAVKYCICLPTLKAEDEIPEQKNRTHKP